MTSAFMCDSRGKFEINRYAFKLSLPLHQGNDLHFCKKECLIGYINNFCSETKDDNQ